jgi:dsRNA-specific ribonuclease
MKRGDWSSVHRELLSNRALHKRGIRLGIHECLITQSGNASEGTVATAMEAIVGAVFKDAGSWSGWARTVELVKRLFPNKK